MVVYHNSAHHAGDLVIAVHAEHVVVNSVVEYAGGNLYLFLGAAYVIPQSINLVVCEGHQVVGSEERAYAYDGGRYDERGHYPGDGYARGLRGYELAVLRHLTHGHHGGKQRSQRKGQRQDGAAAPEEEFADYLQTQALANQFVYVYPQELHDKHEQDHEQDCHERSYERLEYETVKFLHLTL